MDELIGDRWRAREGVGLDLSTVDPASADGGPADKDEAAERTDRLHERLADLQDRFWAEGTRALLVVLQALDGGGKDSTIRRVFTGLNPAGCDVTSFKVPNDEERAHDFLWRIHRHVPARGRIGIFNRSHYEDVLIVRVHDLVPEAVWRGRYRTIRDFEHGLVADGTAIVKLFLHISKAHQAERLQKRLDDPSRRWKFRTADLAERARWDDYQAAFRDAIAETSTDEAPWYVVPADRKWFRDWVVLTILVETLERLDPRYPPAEEDLDSITID